jgi:hypothetical protein
LRQCIGSDATVWMMPRDRAIVGTVIASALDAAVPVIAKNGDASG